MECPSCRALNSAGTRFRSQCASRLARVRPRCSGENLAHDKSEKLNPQDVHYIMGGCSGSPMNEIHRYEGTIDKFTSDGLTALFGAPVAPEGCAR